MDGQPLTIVVLGMGGVGKSALTISYVSNHFVREYGTKQVSVDGQVSVIDILDTAGTEDHMVMRDQWFRAGDGFLLVYSVDEPSTLHYLCELREVDRVPMAIAANKTDLPPELHKVTLEHAKTVLAPFNCQIIETSAKTQTNVSLVFAETVRQARKARRQSASSRSNKKRTGCPLF